MTDRMSLLALLSVVSALTFGGCASSPHPVSLGAFRGQDSAAAEPATSHGFRAISEAEFELLKKSVLFTEDDVRYLRMSRDVLEPHVDELLDVWYGFVGSNEHLLMSFSDPATHEPNTRYLEAVRGRFRQWVLDTAEAQFDQAWLNRQLEYGLRHHRLKKNQTDGVQAADHVAFRYLVALQYPITATMKPFLARSGHSPQEVEGMLEAWRKAVLMTTILWSQPYVAARDF